MLLDKRLLDLVSTMVSFRKEEDVQRRGHYIGFEIHQSGNIYSVNHVLKRESEEAAQQYFGKEYEWEPNRQGGIVAPVCNDEIVDMIGEESGRTATIKYLKKFEDGVIQIAGFGREWGTEPNTCWAIYGHIISEGK